MLFIFISVVDEAGTFPFSWSFSPLLFPANVLGESYLSVSPRWTDGPAPTNKELAYQSKSPGPFQTRH